MPDDPQIGHDEIEELLRQAQGEAAGGAQPETPTESASPPQEETSESAGATSTPDPASDKSQTTPAVARQAAPETTTATAPAASPSVAPSRRQSSEDIAPDDIELLLRQAEAAIASVDQPTAPASQTKEFRLRDFAGASPSDERSTLELIRDVELDLKIELGRTHMPLDEVLRLRKGSVVPLEKLAGDPVDIFVNGRLIARGEVLVMNDNFCVRVAELVASEAVA